LSDDSYSDGERPGSRVGDVACWSSKASVELAAGAKRDKAGSLSATDCARFKVFSEREREGVRT